MQATAEPNDATLEMRLAAVEEQIATGEGDVALALEERESLKREIAAAGIRRQNQADAEYRARNKAKVDDFLKRRDAVMREVGDNVARLLLVLPEAEKLAMESTEVPWSESQPVEEILGVPQDFARDLLAAIRQLAPRTEWDFAATGPVPLKSDRPRLTKKVPTYKLKFPGDMAPPPGFTGVWNYATGRPMDEPVDGEGTSALFLLG